MVLLYRLERLHVHAIFSVLGEDDLFFASLASVYEHVDGVTVITSYDRDWAGRYQEPTGLVERLLNRSDDPDRKVDVIIGHEGNEARQRNRAMDFAFPPSKSRRVVRQHQRDAPLTPIDYFWLVDADEIYDAATVPRLLRYVAEKGRPFYQVAARTYFKSWNYCVDNFEWFTAFVRADRRCGFSRDPRSTLPVKLANRVGPVGRHIGLRLLGVERIPEDIGFFHHASYVGPRARIAAKIRSSLHEHQIDPNWLERVWDTWTPETIDFHPITPRAFHRSIRVEHESLPNEIVGRSWPTGYFD